MRILLSLLLLAALAAPIRGEGDTATARLRPIRGIDGPFARLLAGGAVRIGLADAPPEPLIAEPGYASPPRYACLAFGEAPDALVTLVLETGPDGCVLFVDRNNDNDLTNDGAPGRAPAGSDLVVEADLQPGSRDPASAAGAYPVRITRFAAGGGASDILVLQCAHHREGQVELDGRIFTLGVADRDMDGRFDDLDALALAVDLDEDGTLEVQPGSSELVNPREPFFAGRSWWKVRSITGSGSELTLARVESPLPPPDARLLADAQKLLEAPQAQMRRAAIRIFLRAGTPEAFEVLRECAARHPEVAAIRRPLLDAMGDFVDPAVQAWAAGRGLVDQDPALRLVAVEILGHAPEAQALPALERALHDRFPEVRLAAIAALADLRTPSAIARLAPLTRANDEDLALAAAAALGSLAGVPAVAGEAAATLRALLNEPRAALRTVAAGALGRVADADAFPALLRLLDDPVWTVRAAAIEALGQLRRKEAVPALIARVASEEGRLRHDAAAGLERLTGVRHGTDAAAWRRWWEEHGANFTVVAGATAGAAPAGDETRYYGIPVLSKRVCFLLDVSGSMGKRQPLPGTHAVTQAGPTRLEVAKQELCDTVDRLAKDVRFNVVFFDHARQWWQKKLQPADPGRKADAKAFIAERKPGGGTDLFDALDEALADDQVDTLFLLSDGASRSGTWVRAADMLREIARKNAARRVVIHTICIGGAGRFMAELARANGGMNVDR